LHQFIINIHYKLNADKDKNVYLDRNLYSQVKVTYSVLRKIYLISPGSREILNIFPTDLSGKIDNEHFKFFLRSEGKANHQLESIGKCFLAEMQSEACSEVFGPG
jgi:hypothetical protein